MLVDISSIRVGGSRRLNSATELAPNFTPAAGVSMDDWRAILDDLLYVGVAEERVRVEEEPFLFRIDEGVDGVVVAAAGDDTRCFVVAAFAV